MMRQTIALNKVPPKFINILRQLIPVKLPRLRPDIKINLKFIEVIGNVVNRVVVCRIFVINEHVLVVWVLNEDVIGQKVVVGKYQGLGLQWRDGLVDEIQLLGCYPLAKDF